MDWPFLAALVALCMFASYLRDVRMVGTATVLMLDWAACTVFCISTGDAYPWTAFFVFDYMAAFTILALLGRPTLWQVVVGLIYASELICHASYGLKADPTSLYRGWYFLHYAAWAQVAIMAGWSVYALADHRGLLGRSVSRLEPLLGSYRADSGRSTG